MQIERKLPFTILRYEVCIPTSSPHDEGQSQVLPLQESITNSELGHSTTTKQITSQFLPTTHPFFKGAYPAGSRLH